MAYSSLTRSSKFLFDWTALDGLDLQGRLVARTGQIGTFSRGGTAGTASSVDVNGRVFVPGSSTPRFYHQYDSTTGTYTPRGVVLTGSRKNLVLQPEGLGTASWTDIVAGGTATDGGDTGCGVSLTTLNDTSAVAEYVRGQTVTFTGDAVKAFSCFAKKGTATTSVIALRDVTASAWRLAAELTWSGSVPSVNMSLGGGAGTYIGYQGPFYGNVYRLLFQTSSVTAANTNSVRIYAADTWTGSTALTGTLLIGGVQAEDAAFPSQYIPQTSSALTRSADALTFPVNIEPRAMTVYGKVTIPAIAIDASTNYLLFSLGKATTVAPYFSAKLQGADLTLMVQHDNNGGGGAVAGYAGAVAASGDTYEFRAVLQSDGSVIGGAARNAGAETIGGTSSAATLSSAWSVATLTVGAQWSAIQQAFAAFQSLRIAAGVQTMAYMRAA